MDKIFEFNGERVRIAGTYQQDIPYNPWISLILAPVSNNIPSYSFSVPVIWYENPTCTIKTGGSTLKVVKQ